MLELQNIGLQIRQYYKPLQPTVSKWHEGVSYLEVAPEESLRHLVYCYWELYSDDSLTKSFSYSVVADGCIDIFFNIKDFDDIFIMGYCKDHVSFNLESSFHYIGIRFLPGMLTNIYNINADLLTDQVQSLKDILPSLAHKLNSLNNTSGISHFDLSSLDSIMKFPLDRNPSIDNRFTDALLYILKLHGNIIDMKTISIGVSPRQLRRLFSKYIGTSPKNFSKVVRFQHILTAYYMKEHFSDTYFDSGYYDQAYFIKDFRNFYGITPSQALSRSMQ